MWWTRALATVAVSGALGACAADRDAGTTPACPERGASLRQVEVFDGRPDEMALLVPDVAGERSGHWQLGYIYDAGRTVTLRCRYADAQFTDVALTARVQRCDYRVGRGGTLSVACR